MKNTTKSQQISVKIPYGTAKLLAKDEGFSEGYVSLVLQGKRFNRRILNRAAEILANDSDRDQTIKIMQRLKASL